MAKLIQSKRADGTPVEFFEVNRIGAKPGASLELEHLKRPGDFMRILHEPNVEAEMKLRSVVSRWARRYKLKMKVMRFELGVLRVSIEQGFFEGVKLPGPKAVNFPELGTCEVGDSFEYDYQHPPFRGSYMPIGIEAAMRREAKRGKKFEYSAQNACRLFVLRVK